ncbi:MAG: preprotein translocase subunit SecE [Syntrophales bacterium]|nr:preprotein translocase subunit SecE [Syntrophales bacterium]
MSLITYFKDTKNEMKHVTWPTVRQTVVFTVAVIVVSVIVAALLGLFDYIFSTYVIQNIIK